MKTFEVPAHPAQPRQFEPQRYVYLTPADETVIDWKLITRQTVTAVVLAIAIALILVATLTFLIEGMAAAM